MARPGDPSIPAGRSNLLTLIAYPASGEAKEVPRGVWTCHVSCVIVTCPHFLHLRTQKLLRWGPVTLLGECPKMDGYQAKRSWNRSCTIRERYHSSSFHSLASWHLGAGRLVRCSSPHDDMNTIHRPLNGDRAVYVSCMLLSSGPRIMKIHPVPIRFRSRPLHRRQ